MKATTNITCNGCPDLKIKKRQIRKNNKIDRNIWVLTCGRLIIEIITVRNQDLHSSNLPEIIPPFVCKLRQEARKAGLESKFELQIN